MLWHVTRDDCLHVFPHPDVVTTVDFHPFHERTFVTGCFDGLLRVWDVVPKPKVKEWLTIKEDTVRRARERASERARERAAPAAASPFPHRMSTTLSIPPPMHW